MPRKRKATAEEKQRIVELYLAGKVEYKEASKIFGVGETTIGRLVQNYIANTYDGAFFVDN